MRELLETLQISPDPEIAETPRRVADLFRDLLRPDVDPRQYLKRTLATKHSELIIVKDIEFLTLCKHHLMPFFGKVHIAYIPNGKIVGLSKFYSLVKAYSCRLQIQETFTSAIADAIFEELKPFGVMVICEAYHTCCSIRGRYDFDKLSFTQMKTVTSALRGVFLWNPTPRTEALALLRKDNS